MTATSSLVLAALVLAIALGPLATPAAATHSCMENDPCYPHVDPDVDPTDPKAVLLFAGDLITCLVLAQPPTACL